MLIAIGWIGFSILVANWNQKRGNSFFVGLAISLLFSPVVGALMVAVTKRQPKKAEKFQMKSEGMKKCPFCAELIKQEATRCRFCGSELPSPENLAPPAIVNQLPIVHTDAAIKRKRLLYIAIGFFVLLLTVLALRFLK